MISQRKKLCVGVVRGMQEGVNVFVTRAADRKESSVEECSPATDMAA